MHRLVWSLMYILISLMKIESRMQSCLRKHFMQKRIWIQRSMIQQMVKCCRYRKVLMRKFWLRYLVIRN